MLVSTRGRYALRVMIDLAEHDSEKFVPMKDVAARQEISLKYIAGIMPLLTQAGLVEGMHGKGGGYRLTRAPEDSPLGEILRLTEGTLAPISCLEEGAKPCPRESSCSTLPRWRELNQLITDYLDHKTLADLLGREPGDQYVI